MHTERLYCRDMVELVTDYLEDTLLPEEEARFEAHLSTCGGCPIYVEQMRATVRVLRSLGQPEPAAASATRPAFLDRLLGHRTRALAHAWSLRQG